MININKHLINWETKWREKSKGDLWTRQVINVTATKNRNTTSLYSYLRNLLEKQVKGKMRQMETRNTMQRTSCHIVAWNFTM